MKENLLNVVLFLAMVLVGVFVLIGFCSVVSRVFMDMESCGAITSTGECVHDPEGLK